MMGLFPVGSGLNKDRLGECAQEAWGPGLQVQPSSEHAEEGHLPSCGSHWPGLPGLTHGLPPITCSNNT